MTTTLLPLLGGPLHGGPPWAADAAAHHFHPFGGIMFLLTLLLIIGLAVAAKRGRIGPPPWIAARVHSPEHEARRILAERFANGDISSDEFLERASVLNWTPGAEPFPDYDGKKRKKR